MFERGTTANSIAVTVCILMIAAAAMLVVFRIQQKNTCDLMNGDLVKDGFGYTCVEKLEYPINGS